jgi:carbonic anhydrase/acetyltransferase-like protein (isoleucine patch superfamily)
MDELRRYSLLGYRGRMPSIAPDAVICDGVRIIGDVSVGSASSLWFNAVARGDVQSISIGSRTNIQDLAMLHVSTGRQALVVGSEVTVGHSAILHGCTIADRVLVGMGATVLDEAVVEEFSLVAAGSVVRQGFRVPSGTLVAGVPARVMRELTDQERQGIIESALHYAELAQEYSRNAFLPGG